MVAIKLSKFFLYAAIFGLLVASCGESNKDFDTLKIEGEKAFGAGDYGKAINLLRKAYSIRPSDRDVLFELGQTFKKLSTYDSALAYFKRGKLLYTNDRPINREVLELSMAANNNRDALMAISTLIATGDNEKMYWPFLAELNYREKNYTSAVHYYQLLLKAYPEKADYYLAQSGILAQLGRFEESNEVLGLGIQNFGPTVEFCTNMAINYLKMKNYTKAEEYTRMSLKLEPNSVPIWLNLANLLSDQNDKAKKREGLEIFKKYREGAPEGFKIDSLIGVLEAELK